MASTPHPDPLPLLPPGLLPGPDFVDRAWGASERSPAWLRSFQALFDAGRLAGTGHLCLLAGKGEPEAVAALAQEGGCSGLVAGERALGVVARRYAHRVPLIAAVRAERDPAAQARRLRDMGCVGVCLTLEEEVLHDDAGVTALAAAATAEGLVVVTHVLDWYRSEAPRIHAAGAAYGAALAWRGDWPQYSRAADEANKRHASTPRYREERLEEGRARVVEAWGGRVGQLAMVGTDGDARDTATLAKRAGALGIVVAVPSDPDPSGHVAALHALEDVWADGTITLA
ncbi:MAG: hypothetical protein ACK4YP_07785 [Myxococcota bacterium]